MAKRVPTTLHQYWYKGGICGLISRATLRTLQFVFAVTVAGLYGIDLAHATEVNSPAPTEWVYAEVIAALSAITCIIHCSIPVAHVAWSTWDAVLFVLWLSQMGVFGAIYISAATRDDYRHATLSVYRMRAAVWIDLVNMLLWFATFIMGIAWCCRTRKITRRTDGLANTEAILIGENGDEESALEEYSKELKDLDANNAAFDMKIDANKEEVSEAEMEKQSEIRPRHRED